MGIRTLKKSFLQLLLCGLCFPIHVYAETKELKIVSPHWDGYRREVEDGFTQWYQKKFNQQIQIRWLDLGGASDIGKGLIARKKAKEPIPVDVVFGGGVDLFEMLKAEDMLLSTELPVELKNQLRPTLFGNELIDPEQTWFAVSLTSFGIVFNKTLLERMQVPAPVSFADLALAHFKGMVGTADPRKSGSSRFMYELMLQRYGWEQGWKLIYEISSNVKSFSVYASQAPKDVATGDTAVALLIDSYALDLVKQYGDERIGYVVPQDVFSFFGDPIGRLNTGENPDGGKAFIEFCLSEPGQKIISRKVGSKGGPKKYELGRLPVLESLYGHPDNVRTENPFSQKNGFFYDRQKASGRWSIVTALLGNIGVDLQADYIFARYQKGFDLAVVPPPLDEAHLASLVTVAKSKGIDSLSVEKELKNLKENVRHILPSRPAAKWPMFLLLFGMLWLAGLFRDILFKYPRK